MGRSTKHYQNNAASRKKKAAVDKKINARPEQKKKRAEANKKRRSVKNKRSIQGKDYDHATRKFVSKKINRGRKGEGGRKKKT